jgi:hypothetical protein
MVNLKMTKEIKELLTDRKDVPGSLLPLNADMELSDITQEAQIRGRDIFASDFPAIESDEISIL